MASPQELSLEVGAHGRVSALLQAPNHAQALLALAHGAGTDMRHASMQALADALAAAGIATLRYNFPYKEYGRGRPDSPEVATASVLAACGLAAQVSAGLPLFAGGRSFGGRMTTLAASLAPLPNVRALLLFAFPLHLAGKPAVTRAAHLAQVGVPMLFLQGGRDALATPQLLERSLQPLPRAQLHWLAEADHSFKVLKRSGRTDAEVLHEAAQSSAAFIRSVA